MQALEDAKKARCALGVEARAVVLHFPRHPACAALCGHGAHRNAGGWLVLAELEGVAQHLHQQLVQQGWVGLHGGQIGGHAPLRGLCRGQRSPGFCYRGSQCHRLQVQRRTPHARQGQQPVQHLCHAAGRLLHGADELLRFLQRRALQHIGRQVAQHLAHQLTVRRDVAQRRTQVVRDHAQKLFLRSRHVGHLLLAGGQRGAPLLRGEVGGHVCTSHFHLLPPATEARTAQRGTNAPCTKTQARTASKGRPAAKAVVPLEGEGAKRLRGCLIFLGVASWQR